MFVHGQVFGSRPQAMVTWWKGLEQLNQTFEYTSSDGNVTTSVVTFTPSASDHGSNIACRATNPSMDSESAEEDNWQIAVQCKHRIILMEHTLHVHGYRTNPSRLHYDRNASASVHEDNAKISKAKRVSNEEFRAFGFL